jgi:aminoglycoside phosphotransferase (APT) family kinase protein
VQAGDLELLGAEREAEVFAWDDGRVLRLARDPSRTAMVEREVTALAAAHGAGARVPGVHERITVDGRPGIVLDRIDGVDLLDWLAGHPWAVRSVGKTLGIEHAALHRVEAPGHGDFHPANLLRTADGYAVIDWTNATSGDPVADVARTILLMGSGKLADGAPVVVRVLAPVARRGLLAAYLRTYAREAPLDRDLVVRWLPVWAAARLAEGIEPEREFLLARAR